MSEEKTKKPKTSPGAKTKTGDKESKKIPAAKNEPVKKSVKTKTGTREAPGAEAKKAEAKPKAKKTTKAKTETKTTKAKSKTSDKTKENKASKPKKKAEILHTDKNPDLKKEKKKRSTPKKDAIEELTKSRDEGKALEGVPQSIYTLPNTVIVEMPYKGNYTVKIPAEEFMWFSDFNMRDSSYHTGFELDKIANFASKRLNSKTHFTVNPNGFDEKDKSVYASRIKAMGDLAYRHYVDEKTKIYEVGDVIEARIVASTSAFVICEHAGAEITIRENELAWERVMFVCNDSRFKKNEIIKVKILSVSNEDETRLSVDSFGNQITQTYHKVTVVGSRKQCYKNPADIYFDDFPIGTITTATIQFVKDDGIYAMIGSHQTGFKMQVKIGMTYDEGYELVHGKIYPIVITARDEEKKKLKAKFYSK